ncbi:unnamed protein product [Amoebophrya sp. A120]|nr:unnamed protein product [Amoebophrya sp. A120]|eukprot:GSA120T00020178001.1
MKIKRDMGTPGLTLFLLLYFALHAPCPLASLLRARWGSLPLSTPVRNERTAAVEPDNEETKTSSQQRLLFASALGVVREQGFFSDTCSVSDTNEHYRNRLRASCPKVKCYLDDAAQSVRIFWGARSPSMLKAIFSTRPAGMKRTASKASTLSSHLSCADGCDSAQQRCTRCGSKSRCRGGSTFATTSGASSSSSAAPVSQPEGREVCSNCAVSGHACEDDQGTEACSSNDASTADVQYSRLEEKEHNLNSSAESSFGKASTSKVHQQWENRHSFFNEDDVFPRLSCADSCFQWHRHDYASVLARARCPTSLSRFLYERVPRHVIELYINCQDWVGPFADAEVELDFVASLLPNLRRLTLVHCTAILPKIEAGGGHDHVVPSDASKRSGFFPTLLFPKLQKLSLKNVGLLFSSRDAAAGKVEVPRERRAGGMMNDDVISSSASNEREKHHHQELLQSLNSNPRFLPDRLQQLFPPQLEHLEIFLVSIQRMGMRPIPLERAKLRFEGPVYSSAVGRGCGTSTRRSVATLVSALHKVELPHLNFLKFSTNSGAEGFVNSERMPNLVTLHLHTVDDYSLRFLKSFAHLSELRVSITGSLSSDARREEMGPTLRTDFSPNSPLLTHMWQDPNTINVPAVEEVEDHGLRLLEEQDLRVHDACGPRDADEDRLLVVPETQLNYLAPSGKIGSFYNAGAHFLNLADGRGPQVFASEEEQASDNESRDEFHASSFLDDIASASNHAVTSSTGTATTATAVLERREQEGDQATLDVGEEEDPFVFDFLVLPSRLVRLHLDLWACTRRRRTRNFAAGLAKMRKLKVLELLGVQETDWLQPADHRLLSRMYFARDLDAQTQWHYEKSLEFLNEVLVSRHLEELHLRVSPNPFQGFRKPSEQQLARFGADQEDEVASLLKEMFRERHPNLRRADLGDTWVRDSVILDFITPPTSTVSATSTSSEHREAPARADDQ